MIEYVLKILKIICYLFNNAYVNKNNTITIFLYIKFCLLIKLVAV